MINLTKEKQIEAYGMTLEKRKERKKEIIGKEVETALASIEQHARFFYHHKKAEKELQGVIEVLKNNDYLLKKEGDYSKRQLMHLGKMEVVLPRGAAPTKKNLRSPVFYLAKKTVALFEDGLEETDVVEGMTGFLKGFSLSSKEILSYPDFLKGCLLVSFTLTLNELKKAVERIVSRVGEQKTVLLQVECDKAQARLNCILQSLGRVAGLDFYKEFEGLSEIHKALRKDPAAIYEKMTRGCRYEYIELVERESKKKKVPPLTIVAQAIEKATKQKQHIGLYLQPVTSKKNGVYYFASLYFTLFMVLLLLYFGSKNLLFCLVMLLPALGGTKTAIDVLFTKKIAPKKLARLNLKRIPIEGKTMVTVCTLFASIKDVDRQVDNLEEIYLTNKEENLSFAILGDFKACITKKTKEDEEISTYAVDKIKELNHKYKTDVFCLFLRRRVYSDGEQCYMPWERKRGAITELIGCLGGEETTIDTIVYTPVQPLLFAYLLVLDGDTKPSVGSIKKLIALALHPAQQPVMNHSGTKIVGGYGILAPRIALTLSSSQTNLFTQVFGGAGGIDSYENKCSDIYEDVFEEGIFCGKGLIHLPAYTAILKGKIKENTLLSHDMIEGALLRCGYVSDVVFYDGMPTNLPSYFQRLERWVRGDVQNSLWLFGKQGAMVSGLSKYKIFDNMRRSVTPLLWVGAGAWAFIGTMTHPFAVFCSMAVLFFMPTMMGATLGWRTIGTRCFSTKIGGVKGLLIQGGVSFLFLPYEAYVCTKAVATALVRTYVTKKKMLSWQTAQQGEMGSEKINYYKIMWIQPLVALVFLLFSKSEAVGILLFALWVAAPIVAQYLSKKREVETELTKEEQKTLKEWSVDLWRYYEENITEKNNFLPPDNIQFQPVYRMAKRTSPTNIGLYLLCCLCGYHLGLMKKDAVEKRVTETINTVEKLEKWEGHLYNWYATDTLQVMAPHFVSTVDSGNFLGCLIALKEGLKELQLDETLIETVERIIKNTNFTPLYHEEKQLFSIGYNVEQQLLMPNFYDLMASEARQTSFVAVALCGVPPEHWQSLHRHMGAKRGYMGLKSWTGTMFEYMMPHLLLPAPKGSLLYESMRYCIQQQQERVKGTNIPFGISESAYFAFDSELNYQYRAFGVEALSLKKGMDSDLVIAPYASYLAMMFAPKIAMKNLKELKKLGVYGVYGHYEGVDYNPSITMGEDGKEIVKSFMAHHVGMSMIALTNSLKENVMQKTFLKDRRMKSFSMLLEEKMPMVPPKGKVVGGEETIVISKQTIENPYRERVKEMNVFEPKMNAIGSGNYCVLTMDSGVGFSRWRDIALTTPDFEKETSGGVFTFLECDKGVLHSLTYGPFYEKEVAYETEFEEGQTVYHAKGESFLSVVSVATGAEHQMEIRKIEATNTANEAKSFSLTCYLEPILQRYEDFAAHKTFSRLFLETKYEEKLHAFIIKRRSREQGEKPCFLVVRLLGDFVNMTFETDRAKMRRGRYEGICDVFDSKEGSFDCCLAIKTKRVLQEGEKMIGSLLIGCGESLEEVLGNLNRYKGADGYQKAQKSGAERDKAENALLCLLPREKEVLLSLLPCIYMTTERRRFLGEWMKENTLGRPNLWKFGISGDLPLVLYSHEGDEERLALAVNCNRFYHLKGIATDLVILCEKGNKKAIEAVLQRRHSLHVVGRAGGVWLMEREMLTKEERTLFYAMSKICFEDGFLKHTPSTKPFLMVDEVGIKKPKNTLSDEPLVYDNGYGGFYKDGYLVYKSMKRPFCHVIGNKQGGGVLTETGGGYTFFKNARENKVSQWSNDPCLDLPSETLLLLGAHPISLYSGVARYEKGMGVFSCKTKDVETITTDFFSRYFPVRIRHVKLKNMKSTEQTVPIGFGVKTVCGVDRAQNAPFCKTAFHKDTNILTMRNPMNTDFSRETYFVGCSEKICGYSGEYQDVRSGTFAGGGVGGGLDSCMAIRTDVVLKAREEKEVVFLLGCFENQPQKEGCLAFAKPEVAKEEIEKVRAYFKKLCGAITIETSDVSLDLLMNHFLVYQTLLCRMWARTSFYQCGGAFGYRDQLQDSLAFVNTHEEITKNQIIRCSCHQFIEGDVQHWWHPIKEGKGQSHRGVRTAHSDTHLWLPFVVSRYLKASGDDGLLGLALPYLQGEKLKKGEHSRYFVPMFTKEKESVFEHCLRAIHFSLTFGSHGLCLMKSGDWNDGMNLVGAEGKGESLWLSWFLLGILRDFIPLCQKALRFDVAKKYEKIAMKLELAIETRGWDGAWYVRGFFDSGLPFGSHKNAECQIDSIAQSFSVLSGGTKNHMEHKRQAIQSAYERLVDKKNGIVKLFDPPFEKTEQSVGYIKAYPKGVRENGGQYTHGAVWLAHSLFASGEIEKGYELLDLINPVNHGKTKTKQACYGAEPYVVAADVSSCGVGGWTWYTGSSGWMYTLIVEHLFGLQKIGDYFTLSPALPKAMEGAKMRYEDGTTVYMIEIVKGGTKLCIDGEDVRDNMIRLRRDGKVHIVKMM